jgi:hypothetical protein
MDFTKYEVVAMPDNPEFDFDYDYVEIPLEIWNNHIEINGFLQKIESNSEYICFKPENITIAELDLIFVCAGLATGVAIMIALNEELDAINYGVLCTIYPENIPHLVKQLKEKLNKQNVLAIYDNTLGFGNVTTATDIFTQFGQFGFANIIKQKMKNSK